MKTIVALTSLLLAILLALSPEAKAAHVPAFPGAEGGGAASVGGRLGLVIEVTNLNDSGPGSLRECVLATGPRTCVFRVGGTIHLQSTLFIRNPFITIAGQTAPGGGIQLNGKAISLWSGMISIEARDVIIRYLRVRKGLTSGCGGSAQCGGNINIWGGQGIVLDHVSSTWNQDENIGLWGRLGAGALRDVTVSWSLVAEGLGPGHATGFLTGSNDATVNNMTNIDGHHNVLMNDTHRNPLAKHRSMRWVNNIGYNYSHHAIQLSGGVQADIIGNLHKRGPLGGTWYEVEASPCCNGTNASGLPSIYLSGNKGPHQSNPAGDQWAMARTSAGENHPPSGGEIIASWRRATALANTTFPIIAEPVANIEASILPIVGASRRLDCEGKWVANRDTVDTRLVSEYTNNTGTSVIQSSEVGYGGYPIINGGTPCEDTDRDGMPDKYEVIKGFSTTSASNNADVDSDHFTNLEEFLSGETGAVLPPEGQKFNVADRVFANADTVNVRQTAGGTLLGTQPRNAQGAVLAGPTTTVNGVIWYEINFDSGTDGWVGDGGLELVVNSNTPPAVSVTAPVANSTVSGSAVSVAASASDNVGVVGVQFKLDGANLGAEDTSAPYSVTWDTTTAVNGPHAISAGARDAAGLMTTSASVPVTVNNVASTGFTLGETAIIGANDLIPANLISANSFVLSQRGTVQSVSVFVATAGNIQMGIYDDDGTGGDPGTLLASTAAAAIGGTGWRSVSITTPVTLEPGTYWLAMHTDGVIVLKGLSTGGTNRTDGHTYGSLSNPYVVNASNNWHWSIYATLTPAADVTAPTTAVTAPSAGNVSGTSVSVTGTASDAVGVSGVSFHAVPTGGAPDATNIIGVEDTTSTYGVTWDTTTRVNGPYNVMSVARDAAGNKGTSAAVAVTVANTLATPSGLGVVRTGP